MFYNAFSDGCEVLLGRVLMFSSTCGVWHNLVCDSPSSLVLARIGESECGSLGIRCNISRTTLKISNATKYGQDHSKIGLELRPRKADGSFKYM